MRAGTISPWQLQTNELADEQAKKGSALHPSVAQVERSYTVRAYFLDWLAKFLGRLHAYVKFRGWRDVPPRVQRHRRTLPEKMVVFQREPRRKRSTHARFLRTHTLAKTSNFWFCWRCWFYTTQRVKWLAGQCCGIVQGPGWCAAEAQDGRNPKRRQKLDGTDVTCVVRELERDGLGVGQPPEWHDSHESHWCAQRSKCCGCGPSSESQHKKKRTSMAERMFCQSK